MVARLPGAYLGQGASRGLVTGWRMPLRTLYGTGGVPYCPWCGGPWVSMVSVPLMTHCWLGDVAVAATT